MILVALAGLPGSGKSTLARALAARLGCERLDKDALRAQLFAPEAIAYSAEQDDRVVRRLYERAAELARGGARLALLDGRTFTRRASVEQLLEQCRAHGWKPCWIECRCAPELARARLAADRRAGTHPAANRGPELHERLAREAEPLELERLVLDTGQLELAQQLELALAHIERCARP